MNTSWTATGTAWPVTNSGLVLLALLAAGTAQALPAQQPVIAGAARIVDGDTLRIGRMTIRIHGIDAPEAQQSCPRRGGGFWDCGRQATRRMAALVREGVECTALDQDRYGRIVARCHVGGQDIGQALVAEGLAWAFRKYSLDYAMAEGRAMNARLGVWQARTQPAWAYRAKGWHNAAAAQVPTGGCPIKGNISRDGERIYHTPWSSAYARTRVDERSGERWFCDEGEALAAGWRAAR